MLLFPRSLFVEEFLRPLLSGRSFSPSWRPLLPPTTRFRFEDEPPTRLLQLRPLTSLLPTGSTASLRPVLGIRQHFVNATEIDFLALRLGVCGRERIGCLWEGWVSVGGKGEMKREIPLFRELQRCKNVSGFYPGSSTTTTALLF